MRKAKKRDFLKKRKLNIRKHFVKTHVQSMPPTTRRRREKEKKKGRKKREEEEGSLKHIYTPE